MKPVKAVAVLHPDGSVCVHSIYVDVVGAIVNWALAHGTRLPPLPDEAVWEFWLKNSTDKHGESTLACVAVEPIEGGRIRSLSGIPGDA